ENDWAGEKIPIIPVLGKEIWVDDGTGGAKRKLLSLVRLARDPFMAYCFMRTCQAEIAQQSPKAPYEGYEGQFDTNTNWKDLHKVPTAYVEFKATTEEMQAFAGGSPLPLPRKNVFDASGIQALEITADACRAAVQSAMGAVGMLNNTVKAEAKSGIALRTLNQQESQSNFHFIDNLDIALENGGRQLNDLLKKVEDTERTVAFRKATGEQYVGKINQLDPQGNKIGFHTDMGEHDVTISTGPSFLSERDEADDFAEQLTKMGDPVLSRALLPYIIRQRNLGPLGDEMAKVAAALSPLNQPQQQIPPAVQMQMQKMGALLQKLMQERQAKTLELQGKAWIANQQQQVDLEKKRYDIIGELGMALAKQGMLKDAAAFESQLEEWNRQWERAHEFGIEAGKAAHEQAMSDQAHQQQLEQIAAQPQPAVSPQSPAAQA
ncbi:MAG TPA: portal protein, partial [Acidobacteriaceae bacterium]|nr:portal protein [Acidobacteriaceae bacterium]